MRVFATLLQIVGYPTAIIVIARWVPVVREQRRSWFVAHTLAVAAIVAGWAIKGQTRSVIVNGAWLVVSVVWYVLGGRRRPGADDRPSDRQGAGR